MKRSLLLTSGFLLLLSFFNINAQVVDNLYPVSDMFGTGYWDQNGKFDGDIYLTYPNVGWAVFDLSALPPGSVIQSIKFYGYILSCSYPHWSSTPMGIINPLVDPGPDIYDQIISGYGQNTAYIYQDEWSSFTLGWHVYDLGNGAVPDLQAALNSSQGWFAIGFIVRDFSSGNYLLFAGHGGPDMPYLEVTYQPVPVELTSFKADVQRNTVTLSWQTATETNNKGFNVERSQRTDIGGQSWSTIGFINGNGTTTEEHSYSFIDKNVSPGKYYYRLKQIDFEGTYEYSKQVEVSVNVSEVYLLSQNYPNPFNPSTRISYSVPQTSKVQIEVYDVLGNEVTLLVNEVKQPGVYVVNFNGINLSSGIYFYRFNARAIDSDKNYSKVSKMILLK